MLNFLKTPNKSRLQIFLRFFLVGIIGFFVLFIAPSLVVTSFRFGERMDSLGKAIVHLFIALGIILALATNYLSYSKKGNSREMAFLAALGGLALSFILWLSMFGILKIDLDTSYDKGFSYLDQTDKIIVAPYSVNPSSANAINITDPQKIYQITEFLKDYRQGWKNPFLSLNTDVKYIIQIYSQGNWKESFDLHSNYISITTQISNIRKALDDQQMNHLFDLLGVEQK